MHEFAQLLKTPYKFNIIDFYSKFITVGIRISNQTEPHPWLSYRAYINKGKPLKWLYLDFTIDNLAHQQRYKTNDKITEEIIRIIKLLTPMNVVDCVNRPYNVDADKKENSSKEGKEFCK